MCSLSMKVRTLRYTPGALSKKMDSLRAVLVIAFLFVTLRFGRYISLFLAETAGEQGSVLAGSAAFFELESSVKG